MSIVRNGSSFLSISQFLRVPALLALLVGSLAMVACAPGADVDGGNAGKAGGGAATGGDASGKGGNDGKGGSGATAGGNGGEGGDPGTEPDEDVCDPYAPRANVPEVLIGPGDFEDAVLKEIDDAQSSIDLMMYQFTRESIWDALADAAQRGVAVRVMVDPDEWYPYAKENALTKAGGEFRKAPAKFDHNHAKVMILDKKRSVVLSGNFNDYTLEGERNYGVIDTDLADIVDLRAIFDADWTGSTPDLSCTRLIVTPENSRDRLTDFIDGAQNTLSMAVMYISDSAILQRVLLRKEAGVDVKVILANPNWIDGNAGTAKTLDDAGIPVKYMLNYDLHAKLVIADEVAFVGSENFSSNALKNNREVGMLIPEAAAYEQINTRFEKDWKAATTAL